MPTDAPTRRSCPKASLQPARTSWVFDAGGYLDAIGAEPESPRFLDQIPLRFGISDTDAHYHVPLLLSPFGYSTYRGS